MSSPHSARRRWNEFQWEREIRRDEKRISCYFYELPGCLDLPGEEDMIFNSLSLRPDLVPIGGNPESFRSWCDDDEEEDDDDERRDPALQPGGELIGELDRLAAEWNALLAGKLNCKWDPFGLGVSCAYGKLLARVADFLDADPEEPGLKISLGKRSLADLNELTGALTELSFRQKNLSGAIASQIERLLHIRSRLTGLVAAVRRNSPSRNC